MQKSFLFSLLLVLFSSCQFSLPKEVQYYVISGSTMGTYYRITYTWDDSEKDFYTDVEALLREINMEVSTYIETSTISQFNKQQSAEKPFPVQKSSHFHSNFQLAKKVFKKTGGSFDPTVMPLVNYWGFGYEEKRAVKQVDRVVVDSLMQFVGFDKVKSEGTDGANITKENPGVQLDFSACAKGYAVDAVGLLFEKNGVKDYLVDIGGEQRAKGRGPRGDWQIGINVPMENAALDDIQAILPLKNRAVATSGNYRNFYEVDGVKYSHTINPNTGFPERNTLLSASVFASDCMTADAYATAFMVMGQDKAFELAGQLEGIEAYFIYGEEDGSMGVRYTDGLAAFFD